MCGKMVLWWLHALTRQPSGILTVAHAELPTVVAVGLEEAARAAGTLAASVRWRSPAAVEIGRASCRERVFGYV